MDDEDEGTLIGSTRFRKVSLLFLPLIFTQGVAHGVSDCCLAATEMIAAHLNWKNDQERFAQEAALSIETIIAGGERG